MPQRIRAREVDRDEEFGIFRKQIQAPSLSSFETPTKCLKNIRYVLPTLRINEVIKRITPDTVESMQSRSYPIPSVAIKKKFLLNKLNLTIFHLMYKKVPTKYEQEIIVNNLYAGSESTLFLPTVQATMLKDGNRISDKKFEDYVEMMRHMIELTERLGNRLAFIGTVPLIAPKFTRKLISLYLDKGITAFAVDGGTKDFLNHVAEFRTILSEISRENPLEETFIYACNLGIPRYNQNIARADDFLSILAYVDAFGTTFRTRGGRRMVGERRAKEFVKEHLFYRVSNYNEFCRERHLSQSKAIRFLIELNQAEQLKEADKVRSLVGKKKMQEYLDGKSGVDKKAMRRLGSIVEKVKTT